MKQSTVKEFSVSDYRRTIKLEYRIYFALIFLISIPLATFIKAIINSWPDPIAD